MIITYECEICGAKSNDINFIKACEARGLPKEPCKKNDEIYLHLSDIEEWKNKYVKVRILNWNVINRNQKIESNHRKWRLFLDKQVLTETMYMKCFSDIVDVNDYIILLKEDAEKNYKLDESLLNPNI